MENGYFYPLIVCIGFLCWIAKEKRDIKTRKMGKFSLVSGRCLKGELKRKVTNFSFVYLNLRQSPKFTENCT